VPLGVIENIFQVEELELELEFFFGGFESTQLARQSHPSQERTQMEAQ